MSLNLIIRRLRMRGYSIRLRHESMLMWKGNHCYRLETGSRLIYIHNMALDSDIALVGDVAAFHAHLIEMGIVAA